MDTVPACACKGNDVSRGAPVLLFYLRRFQDKATRLEDHIGGSFKLNCSSIRDLMQFFKLNG